MTIVRSLGSEIWLDRAQISFPTTLLLSPLPFSLFIFFGKWDGMGV